MSFYTFDSNYQTADAVDIWDKLVEHVELNENFRSVSRQNSYKAKLENGNISFTKVSQFKKENQMETLDRETTLCALDTVRLLSTLNANTIRPYLRQAKFPVTQCNPLIGLLLSAEVLKKDR